MIVNFLFFCFVFENKVIKNEKKDEFS